MRDRTELTGELSIGQQLDAIDEAIAAEREACATIAATHIPGRARGVTMPFGIAAAVKEAAHQIAAAIRARGTTT